MKRLYNRYKKGRFFASLFYIVTTVYRLMNFCVVVPSALFRRMK